MRARLGLAGLLCGFGLLGAAVPQEPHFDAARAPREYAGPGRGDPVPDDLTEVAIAWFGPDDPGHPLGGDLWLAASLAFDEANAGGGHRGLPFRLHAAWSENPWGTGVARIARLTYTENVWAMIGSIDGAGTHLAEQVVAKARLTLLSPVSSDESVNMANVAWAFSCFPPDAAQARAVAAAIGRNPIDRLTLVSGTDHDSRAAAVEYRKALEAGSSPVSYHIEIGPPAAATAGVVERIASTSPDSVLLLAGPLESARLIGSLRARMPRLRIYGGSSFARRAFLEQAGAAAEGAVFPMPCDLSFASTPFAREFESRSGRPPDCAAAQTYDAARLLVDAIRRADLNRPRIREAVQEMSPWRGAAGSIRWNRLGQNEREVSVVTVRGGLVSSLASADTR